MQKIQKYRTKTNHLSFKEIKNLKSEYYAGKNIKELIQKYKIDISPTSFVRSFPLVEIVSEQCIYCEIAMFFIPPSKENKNRKEYICTTCYHKESVLRCRCKKCLYQKAIEKEDEQKKKSLKNKQNKNTILNIREYSNAPLLRMLSIIERLYLGALLRVHLSHDVLLIDLNNSSAQNYAPTAEYQDKILIELLDKHIIVPYEIRKNESSETLEKYLKGELYDICISDIDMDKRELIIELMYPDNGVSYLYEDINILREEIHVNEAIEYMMLIIQKFDFYIFNVEEKYRILFSQILKKYSLEQLFNFIYTAIRNQAVNFKQKQCDMGYIPIANYIYKSISDRHDKAQNLGWNIRYYNRIFEAPETELSKLLNMVLKD